MNNLLEESIYLFINIIPFTSIICKAVKHCKDKIGISIHHNGKVKDSKASHLPIPKYIVTETTPPRIQVVHTNKSIQRNLN